MTIYPQSVEKIIELAEKLLSLSYFKLESTKSINDQMINEIKQSASSISKIEYIIIKGPLINITDADTHSEADIKNLFNCICDKTGGSQMLHLEAPAERFYIMKDLRDRFTVKYLKLDGDGENDTINLMNSFF